MDLPITLDDLKEQLQEILPGCDYEIDEDNDEIIIHTNRREDANGDLEEIESDDDPEEDAIIDEEETLELLEENEND